MPSGVVSKPIFLNVYNNNIWESVYYSGGKKQTKRRNTLYF